MMEIMDLSSVDWSVERASGIVFFYEMLAFVFMLRLWLPYLALSVLEKFSLTALLLLLLLSKVFFVKLGHVDGADVDFGGSRNHVSSVDAAQWDAVDTEGTCNEQDTAVEGLEKDDALAAESAGEDYDDCAGC